MPQLRQFKRPLSRREKASNYGQLLAFSSP